MSTYKNLSPEQQEELFSQFLISSWSYSKVSAFARNEKAFEMNYIFGLKTKRSATTVAGEAYHAALQYFFQQLKDGNMVDLVDLEKAAFEYIEGLPSNVWKIQKTTKTVEECVTKAITTCNQCLRNFIGELPTYLDGIDEIVDVEVYGDEFVSVNGVEIPLPLHFKIDVVASTKEGKLIVIDHKSKNAFTPEDEIALSIGVQAVTYAIGYEAKTGRKVNEVWFVENKYSKNKDGGAQLAPFKYELDDNTRRLYEALLYEPLRRMISAVNDPDYIYLINNSDNYVDRAELYDFWCRTMISEVEDFNVEESKRELVAKRLKKVRDASTASITPKIINNFRQNAATFIQYDLSSKDMTREQKIEHVLRTFGIVTKVAYKFDGFSSATYLLEFSAGTKIASIYSHRLDLANALDVSNIRIHTELVVHEGRSYVAIDCEKKMDDILYFDGGALVDRKIPLGKDNFGNVVYWDLDNHSTPHMLVCGATGSGKSVLLKGIMEYACLGPIDKIVVLDPKFEFVKYQNRENFLVVNDIEEIEQVMRLLVQEMQENVRNGGTVRTMVIFDEFADAIANSKKGKDLKIYEHVVVGQYKNGLAKTKREVTGELKSLEENMRILVQKGRSVGYRVIAATQRASVNVITGDAKVNFPVQVCFRVPKETDSRVVLDEAGAESLAGMGDGLIKSPEYKDIVRFQAYYCGSDKPKAKKAREMEVSE